MPARKRKRFTHSENTFYHAEEEATEADDPGAKGKAHAAKDDRSKAEPGKSQMGNRR